MLKVERRGTVNPPTLMPSCNFLWLIPSRVNVLQPIKHRLTYIVTLSQREHNKTTTLKPGSSEINELPNTILTRLTPTEFPPHMAVTYATPATPCHHHVLHF